MPGQQSCKGAAPQQGQAAQQHVAPPEAGPVPRNPLILSYLSRGVSTVASKLFLLSTRQWEISVQAHPITLILQVNIVNT